MVWPIAYRPLSFLRNVFLLDSVLNLNYTRYNVRVFQNNFSLLGA